MLFRNARILRPFSNTARARLQWSNTGAARLVSGNWASPNTLAIAKRLEDNGFPREQAQALADEVFQLATDIAEKSDNRFASKDTQKHELHNLKNELDKLSTSTSYDISRVANETKLELNLEKGRLKDELGKIESKITNAEARIDREISNLRSHIENTKVDLTRYAIGTVFSTTAVGLGVLRFVS